MKTSLTLLTVFLFYGCSTPTSAPTFDPNKFYAEDQIQSVIAVKIFHKGSCPSVASIINPVVFSTRAEAIKAGYEPDDSIIRAKFDGQLMNAQHVLLWTDYELEAEFLKVDPRFSFCNP